MAKNTKVFVGNVSESAPNEFTNDKGEVITTHRLAILLTDDRGILFNVSSRDPNYPDVAALEEGNRVRIVAYPEVRPTGVVRWKVQEVELLADEA